MPAPTNVTVTIPAAEAVRVREFLARWQSADFPALTDQIDALELPAPVNCIHCATKFVTAENYTNHLATSHRYNLDDAANLTYETFTSAGLPLN